MKKFEEMSEQELIKLRGQLTLGQIGAMVTYCSLPFVSLLDVKYDNTIPTIGYWTVFLSLSFMKNKINKELGRTVDPKLKIELLNLYKEILNNLKELNDKFDNENLIERYSLLEYLYNNKYLSINGDKKVIDNGILEADMMGALSLNGHGVCRHTSFLTEDYLKMFNYDAGVLTGLHESNPVKVIESLKYDDEYDEFEDEMIDKFVAIIKEHEEDFKENFSLIEKIFGNHQICMANDQEHS